LRIGVVALSEGFAKVGPASVHAGAALANLESWLAPAFADYWPQLEHQLESGHWNELLDAFYRVLPFGTGGRRGRVGIGPNRFNQRTLALSVQGHVDYLRSLDATGPLSVVIAYDVRQFHDFRGVYAAERPSPLLGMRSSDFARIAAAVYASRGVRVHMLLQDDGVTYTSTPELSFAIRKLGASAGLNVSASHNHPDDNGGKIYNQRGAQVVPPDDEIMAKCVEAARLDAIPDWDAALRTGLISALGPEIHESFVRMVLDQSLAPRARSARVVFTPLCGTSGGTAGAVLERAGFRVDWVEAQRKPDGTFSSVPYRAPNPEVPESMQMGLDLAHETDADLVIACDPDADRIGICARTRSGEMRFLSGNEICLIVAYYKLGRLYDEGRLPAGALAIKTYVTTSLLQPLVESFGARLIGDLLVGFKYHAYVLEQLEEHGRFGELKASLADFVLGVEESHGVLTSPELRDKDAAGAALLVAELASLVRERGLTIVDTLDEIYKTFGYAAAAPTSMVMTGATGFTSIQAIQRKLRERTPQLRGYTVELLTDFWNESEHGPFLSETDRVCRDIVAYRVGDARVIVRPSGTEPKTKLYVELLSKPLGVGASDSALAKQRAETDRAAKAVADAFLLYMLSLIDVVLPRYALRISQLVSLEDRVDFVERFVPELQARCDVTDSLPDVSTWIDTRLKRYGKDARGLVGDALREYLDSRDAGDAELRERMRAAFFGA